jgi:hypothetical protein
VHKSQNFSPETRFLAGLLRMMPDIKSNLFLTDTHDLETMLLKSPKSAYFRATKLYTAIEQWEKNNHPFQVLANL